MLLKMRLLEVLSVQVMGKKGGNHLPAVAVRWHHISVIFLPFFFFVCNVKKGQFIQNLA